MAKLTKAQSKAHQHAEELLTKDVLTFEDKLFVMENWREDAQHVNSSAGAFFTPHGLARDFALHVPGNRVIDLCAGAGALSLALWESQAWERHSGAAPLDITCVELNPEYARVGRKLLPEATWIEASIFDLPDLGHFDTAISNPPFGNITRGDGGAPRYKGSNFEYHVIDLAADTADFGAFIIPSMSAGFKYSGSPTFERIETTKHKQFVKQTAIDLEFGIGCDLSIYKTEWHGVSPELEIVCTDFTEAPHRQVADVPDVNVEPDLLDMLGAAA